MTIKILVTDGNLVPLGDPIEQWTSLSLKLQFNAVGSGTVVLPALPDVLSRVIANRARLLVIRDGAYFMGGPIEAPGPFDRVTGSDAEQPGQLTIGFADDLAWIANETTYPDPTHASTAQTAAYYTATSTNAETLMRDLVNLNAGPGALAPRQVPALALGSVAGVGTPVNYSTRFEPLCDALRAVALAGGGLGFRTIQSAGQILFEVYQPADLSNRVRFSWGLGNLLEVHYTPQAPTATVAIVGGDGTGSSRTIRERVNSAAVTRWGRIEVFVNQGATSDTTQMDQAGDQALADGGEQAQLSVVAVDADGQRYGTDYQLGDIVAVEVYPGLQISEVVRAVTLTATPDSGEVVSPLIGSDSTITDLPTLKRLRQIEARLGQLERT